MDVTRISIAREGYFADYNRPDTTKPFRATVEVHGQHGKVELTLDEGLSARVVEIIADEIAAAGRATAEALTASAILHSAPALSAA